MRLKKSKNNISPNLPSSEELFVQHYFEEKGIKYISEYKINNLKDDIKKYRKVDFYLPRLDVYVEYFGMYNSTKVIREDYDEKVRVYVKNNLPTVILYPHELGILDYAFHRKILKVLRLSKFKNNFKMFRYKLSRYFSKGKGYYFFISLLSLFLSMNFLVESKGDMFNINFILYLLCMGIASVFLIQFFLKIVDVFFKDE